MLAPCDAAVLSRLLRYCKHRADGSLSQSMTELAGLPDVDPDPTVHDVDLPRLLEILDSDEVYEFREWLRDIGSLEDADVEREITKIYDAVRRAVRARTGKIVRFCS